jgi:hypothetical protein
MTCLLLHYLSYPANILCVVLVLGFLGGHSADALSAELARKFTAKIDQKSGYPSAKEALRMCYYMRSQGIDTYAQIDPKKFLIKLYVAKAVPTGSIAMPRDQLYWVCTLL